MVTNERILSFLEKNKKRVWWEQKPWGGEQREVEAREGGGRRMLEGEGEVGWRVRREKKA